jgi:hypothetical protein
MKKKRKFGQEIHFIANQKKKEGGGNGGGGRKRRKREIKNGIKSYNSFGGPKILT